VQHGIKQHRRVTRRQHKPIPVRPDRIVRVKPQMMLPKLVRHRRQRHRRPRMPAVGGLNGVHRQTTNGIDGSLNDSLLIAHVLLPKRQSWSVPARSSMSTGMARYCDISSPLSNGTVAHPVSHLAVAPKVHVRTTRIAPPAQPPPNTK